MLSSVFKLCTYSQMKLIIITIISFFFLAFDNAVLALRVGLIRNVSLAILPFSNITMNASTCNECRCTMLKSIGNSSIVSFNCYEMNITSVVCQLFTKANYSLSFVNHIESNVYSTFYFLQLPSNNQSTMTTTNTITTFRGKRFTYDYPPRQNISFCL